MDTQKNAEIENATAVISAGENVKRVLETKGWKKHIEPLLKKMIQDIIGHPEGELWNKGMIEIGERPVEWYLGYRAFGIEFYNHIKSYAIEADMAKERIKGLTEETEKYTQPMVDDTEYSQ
jgi:hypothetical protein